MRYSTVGLVCVSLCLFGSSSLASNNKAHDRFEEEIQKTFDRATQQDLIGSWLSDRLNQLIKHGIDREVDRRLHQHPLVQAFSHEVKDWLSAQTAAQRAFFLSQTGLAMPSDGKDPGQYPDIFERSEQIAKILNFSELARKKMRIFVTTGPVNAFTYSGLPHEFIDVVLFSGLIDLMKLAANDQKETPEKALDLVGAVIGHEMGHIKARHVLNNILVISIFLATGENVIPSLNASLEIQGRQREELHKTVRGQLAKALNHGSYGDYHLRGLTEYHEAILQGWWTTIQRTANLLNEKYSFAQLKSLAIDMAQAISPEEVNPNLFKKRIAKAKPQGVKHSEGDKDEEEEDDEMEGLELSYEDLVRFVMSLERYSRSCEVTADRYGRLVSNLDVAELVYAKLAAAQGGSAEGMRRQMEILAELFQNHKELEEPTILSQGTHPSPVFRAIQHRNFQNNIAYQIYSDSFLKALDTYVGVAGWMDGVQKEMRNPGDQSAELMSVARRDLAMKSFTAFEKDLVEVLFASLVDELGQKQPKLDRFKKMLDYLHQRTQSREPLPVRMGMAGGLIYSLWEALQEMDENEVRDKAIDLLSYFIRSHENYERRLPSQFIEAKAHELIALANSPDPSRSARRKRLTGTDPASGPESCLASLDP